MIFDNKTHEFLQNMLTESDIKMKPIYFRSSELQAYVDFIVFCSQSKYG